MMYVKTLGHSGKIGKRIGKILQSLEHFISLDRQLYNVHVPFQAFEDLSKLMEKVWMYYLCF